MALKFSSGTRRIHHQATPPLVPSGSQNTVESTLSAELELRSRDAMQRSLFSHQEELADVLAVARAEAQRWASVRI